MARELNITVTSNKPNIELVAKAMYRFILELENQEIEDNKNNSGNN